MRTKFLTGFAVSLVFLLTSALVQAETAEVTALLAKGDALALKFLTVDALQCFQDAEKLAPTSVAVLTRISREYRHLSTDKDKSADQQRYFAKEGVRYGEAAVKQDPDNAGAHLAVAISYGKLTHFLTSDLDKFRNSTTIKSELDTVFNLVKNKAAKNKDFKDVDLAWNVLGRWNYLLAERRQQGGPKSWFIPSDATYEEARKCFENAINLDKNEPRRLMHWIELGKCYWKMANDERERKNNVKAGKYYVAAWSNLKVGINMSKTDIDDDQEINTGNDILRDVLTRIPGQLGMSN